MDFRFQEQAGVCYLTSPLIEDLDGPLHAFGVRPNPGAPSPSTQELLHALDQPGAMALLLDQVHGSQVLEAHSAEEFPLQGDAVQTGSSSLAPTVRTADCVPILLWHKRGVFVSAVHAGWRGLKAGIVQEAVQAMRRSTGAPAGDLIAAVGPSIGPCCYEVGEEVSQNFAVEFAHPGFSDRPYLDLWGITCQQLEAASLPRQQISMANLCTACNPDWFPSYRRNGGSDERMFSLILCDERDQSS